MRLIGFEVQKWLKRPVFYAALLIIVLFVGAQLGDSFFTESFAWPQPPTPGLVATDAEPAPYGWVPDNSEKALMEACNQSLLIAAHENPVTVPALGGMINRQVKLSVSQIELVRDAFFELSGQRFEDNTRLNEPVPSTLPYGEYTERIAALNEALGERFFTLDAQQAAFVPGTYEDALKNYEVMTKDGGFAWSNARLYADYMGIALAFAPLFLSAFLMGRGKRSGAAQAIDARPVTGVQYLFVKYLGLALPLCAFVLLLSLIPTVGAYILRAKGHPVDALAYLLIGVSWLLPTVLAVCALGLFVSVLTGSGIAAIPIGILWWFVSVGRPGLAGPYPLFVSLIRFNRYALLPAEWASQIMANRVFMVGLSLALVAFSGLIYDRKRARGGSLFNSTPEWIRSIRGMAQLSGKTDD